jgi:hypothetical protein
LLGGSNFFELHITDTQPYGTNPTLLVVDADNDGHMDLTTGDRTIMGDGVGGVREIVALTTSTLDGAHPVDFDRDGVTDLVWRHGLGVLLVHGGQLFPEPAFSIATSQPPQDLATGDFDGDGLPDMMVVYQYGDSMPSFELAWLRGMGNGEFQEVAVDEDVNGTSLRSGPYFGDDDATDLYLGGEWFAGGTAGLTKVDYWKAEYGIDPYLFLPLAADVTCDARVDLVGLLHSTRDGILGVYSQRATGGYSLTDTFSALVSESEDYPDEWVPWDAADLNFDGLPDLALVLNESNYDSFGPYVAFSTGDGTFAEPVGLDTMRPWFAIKIVDFNEDGVADLAGVTQASGPPTIFGGVEVLFQEP